MKRPKVLPIITLISFLLLGFQSYGRGEIANRVVALVNSELITLYELNKRIRVVTGLDPIDLKRKDEKAYLQTRRQVLDALVNEKIALEKVRELGIEVTPKEVDAAIERLKQTNHLTHEDLIDNLKRNGMTYEAYRGKIKSDLERAQLINFEVKSKIIIREEKIKAYYNAHIDEFSSAEKVHLAAIFLKQKDPSAQDEALTLYRKGERLVSRIKSGEDFAEIARENSQGPGAEGGGDLGLFRTSNLDPELAKIVQDMSPEDVSEPIIRPSGIQIIKLVERERGSVRPLEKVKDAIYGILYREEINRRYTSWINELREQAYLKIIF
jgi:peptidyl-prolyl cis-trans isomerase SurA